MGQRRPHDHHHVLLAPGRMLFFYLKKMVQRRKGRDTTYDRAPCFHSLQFKGVHPCGKRHMASPHPEQTGEAATPPPSAPPPQQQHRLGSTVDKCTQWDWHLRWRARQPALNTQTLGLASLHSPSKSTHARAAPPLACRMTGTCGYLALSAWLTRSA